MKKMNSLSKMLILLLAFPLLFLSCDKSTKDEHYTVTIIKDAPGAVTMNINNAQVRFEDNTYTKEVDVKWPSSLDVHTAVTNEFKEQITVSLADKDGKFIGDVIDAGYVAILAADYAIFYRSTDNNTGGSGGGSSSTGSHLCGHPTQSGKPCKNRVSNAYTYCYLHR